MTLLRLGAHTLALDLARCGSNPITERPSSRMDGAGYRNTTVSRLSSDGGESRPVCRIPGYSLREHDVKEATPGTTEVAMARTRLFRFDNGAKSIERPCWS